MTDFIWNVDRPLDRYRPESKKAYQAFRDYVRMGVGRSLRKLLDEYLRQAQDPLKTPPVLRWVTISYWSATYEWPARAARADELQREADEEALREERLERERRRMQRREAWEEQEWALSQQLTKLAQDVLAEAPNFLGSKRRLVRGRNGEPDQLIITVSLDGNLAVKAADAASKLARLSTGNPTESLEIRNDDLTDEARAERIAILLGRARERKEREETP